MQRRCPKCNWLLPSTYKSQKCRFCKTTLDFLYCKECDTYLSKDNFYKLLSKGYAYTCKKCSSKINMAYDKDNPLKRKERAKRFYVKHKYKLSTRYVEWLNKLFRLPTQPKLTETEWYEACEYFEGCAICGNEHIEIREYFVRLSEGGMYSKVNIFPACVKCGTAVKRVDNPFSYYDSADTARIDKLIKYFEAKMEELIDV